MKSPPKTWEEAEKRRYGPAKLVFKSHLCAYEKEYTTNSGVTIFQCFTDPGHGPGRLYCPEHAEIVKAYYEGGEE